MKNPVIAIGLDSADPILLEKYIKQGYLKNLAKLRSQGTYGRLFNPVQYPEQKDQFVITECLWVIFATGCLPHKTGYWTPVDYRQDSYQVTYDTRNGGYDYQEYLPFYTLLENQRATIFDLPVSTLCEQVNGLQVLGWGGHDPFTPSHSLPPELLPELTAKHGKDQIYQNDIGIWWDKKYRKWLPEVLKTNIAKRSAICQDLLSREPWDFFLTVLSETHTAGHDLCGYSYPDHPLYQTLKPDKNSPDVMLEVYEHIDQAVGEILAQAPENAYTLVFSLHGMDVNMADLLTMLFLPEYLYRFNFPGKTAIAPGEIDTPPGPMITNPVRNSWLGEIWVRNTPQNWAQKLFKSWTPSNLLSSPQNGLDCPFSLLDGSHNLAWMPSRWYQPLWSQMKAFALPTFTDGQIRINLKGREAQGIVEPSEYDGLCEEITQFLSQIVNARTGKPVVKRVIRTRQSPLEDESKLPDADLIVKWYDTPVDVVDSPQFGRIGPVPYFRPGGHRERGFLMATGPGITPNSSFGSGNVVDLPATMLHLLNVPIPDYFDGKSLLENELRTTSV
ncbi:MAG: nucleotide pyrophosphatase [Gloeocapsa sp. DLM2.Bin57]|nr:MAG: nucleotide pyrophosphatase [Gloeocapsa sp. DLM2.Bin57]